MGRRPRQPAPRARWIAKADVAPSGATNRVCVGPPLAEGFLFSTSVISQSSIQAYLETNYHVDGSMPLTLKIGVANDGLATLHTSYGVESSAYLTACNPFSEALVDSVNDQRMAVLASELQQLGLSWIEGIGKHPTNGWAGEQSYLVLGLSREEALRLGARHEQNAIVWCGLDTVPELVLLR